MKFKVITLVLAILISLSLPFAALAESGVPFSLEAPKNLSAKLVYTDEGIPYFELRLDIPQSVIDINRKIIGGEYPGYGIDEIAIIFDYKYGEYDWNEGESLYWDTSMSVTEYLDFGCYEYFPWGYEIPEGYIIEEEVYSFRAYFYTLWGYEGDWIDKNIKSGYSNTATVGNTAYSAASDWAKPWLEKAEEYGLMPDSLSGADMTKPITRAEFCALSVKLYEAMSGKSAAPVSVNPFTDTKDPEILKAVNIGITNGTSKDKFTPDGLLTREQAATMLTRAYKACFWEGWTLDTDATYSANTLDTSGVSKFSDDDQISEYAKQSVYFMVKNHIIDGVGNNMFAPKANPSASTAVNYGIATREAAVKIAVATFENLA